jgi:DNA polymerase bacteriophage-type
MRCHIDVETYAKVDLRAAGVYPYAEHPDTEVLCACWSVGEGPVQTWIWGSPPPVLPEDAEWWAFNAQFDANLWYYVLHKRCGWAWPGWDAFRCSMVAAAYGNLPGNLAEVAKALGTAEKDKLGHKLMMTLCKPAHETTKDDDPKRRHTPEALGRLAAYCAQDVIAERALHHLLPELPASELALWQLDQKINRRGVHLDQGLIRRLKAAAQGIAEIYREELREVTDGAVASETCLASMMTFVREEGTPVGTGRGAFDKEAVQALLDRDDVSAKARRALEIRQLLGKSSLSKLDRMQAACCADGRIRGTLQFYGAHQTGRWAGRIIQPQNLPRGVFSAHKEYAVGLEAVEVASNPEAPHPEWMVGLYGEDAMDVLATLIRPCLCAAPGKVLVVADYSAIEARGQAWVSGEKWRLDVFRGDGKIYEASAARTLGVPVASILKGSLERGLGKLTELALGYQGGPKALDNFGAVEIYGIPVERHRGIVDAWRAASPMMVRLWRGLQEAAHEAVNNPGQVTCYGYARFKMVGPHLRMALPSGRNLWYRNASIEMEPAPWDADKRIPQLIFWGEDADGHWGRQKAYGGLLTNNLVQGLCRDLMAHAMVNAEQLGFPVILTVHDELVCEVDDPGEAAWPALARELEGLMCVLPDWAKGLPVAASGWAGKAYRK